MDNTVNYQKKYIEYKFKYLELKKQYAGSFSTLTLPKNMFKKSSSQSTIKTKESPKPIPKWLSTCTEMNASRIRSYQQPVPCIKPK